MRSYLSVLNALAKRMDHDVRNHHQSEHTRLVNETRDMIDQATKRGCRMANVWHQWKDVDQLFKPACERLQGLEELIRKSPNSVEEMNQQRIKVNEMFGVEKSLLDQVWSWRYIGYFG